jgi:hypothetical protein
VRLDRIEPQRRRGDAGEREHVVRDDDLGLAKDWVTESDVYAEWLSVDLPRELARGAKAKPVVLHAVVLDRRVIIIRDNLECHEVAKVLASGLLQLREHVVG